MADGIWRSIIDTIQFDRINARKWKHAVRGTKKKESLKLMDLTSGNELSIRKCDTNQHRRRAGSLALETIDCSGSTYHFATDGQFPRIFSARAPADQINHLLRPKSPIVFKRYIHQTLMASALPQSPPPLPPSGLNLSHQGRQSVAALVDPRKWMFVIPAKISMSKIDQIAENGD